MVCWTVQMFLYFSFFSFRWKIATWCPRAVSAGTVLIFPYLAFYFCLSFYREIATWSLRAGLGWSALMFPYLTLKPMPVCIGYLNLTTCIEMMKKVGTYITCRNMCTHRTAALQHICNTLQHVETQYTLLLIDSDKVCTCRTHTYMYTRRNMCTHHATILQHTAIHRSTVHIVVDSLLLTQCVVDTLLIV